MEKEKYDFILSQLELIKEHLKNKEKEMAVRKERTQRGTSAAVQISMESYDNAAKQKIVAIMSNQNMSYADALTYVENEIEQSKRMTDFTYRILCFKSDGAYQLHKAIEEVFGVAMSRGASQPSGGEGNLQTLDIQLADGTRLKVPYGQISLEGLGEGANIQIQYEESSNLLHVNGQCQFRFASLIDDIIERTKELLSTDSIYKNQAITIETLSNPTIMDLSNIDKELMVLSDATKFALQPLQARLLNPQECIERNVPLKYGCLLEGPYGTGKTLLAFKLAKDAIQNGWIFVYLKSPNLLANTLKLIQTIDNSGYGSIVFVEDIDQVTRGNRDSAMQEILNTLDGGDTKGSNIISLFTTNHIELIEPTFLRGKRIGSIISLDYLDEKTAEEFIRASFVDSGYEIGDDLTTVTNLVKESKIVPAFMAEIIEAVKSNMIMSGETFVKNEYFIYSIQSYLRQVQLSQKKDMSLTPEVQLAQALRTVLKIDPLLLSTSYSAMYDADAVDSDENSTYLRESKRIVNGEITVEKAVNSFN